MRKLFRYGLFVLLVGAAAYWFFLRSPEAPEVTRTPGMLEPYAGTEAADTAPEPAAPEPAVTEPVTEEPSAPIDNPDPEVIDEAGADNTPVTQTDSVAVDESQQAELKKFKRETEK